LLYYRKSFPVPSFAFRATTWRWCHVQTSY